MHIGCHHSCVKKVHLASGHLLPVLQACNDSYPIMFFELLSGLKKLAESGMQCGAFAPNNTGSESSRAKQCCSINLTHNSLIPSPSTFQGNSTSFKQFHFPQSNSKVRRSFLGMELEVNIQNLSPPTKYIYVFLPRFAFVTQDKLLCIF